MIFGEANGVQSMPATLNVVADASQIARVELSESSVTVSAGSTHTLTASAYNAADQPVSTSAFVWTSSDTTVATVDSNGLISAIQTGTSQIRATVDGIASAPALVTVPGRTKSGTFSPAPGSSYTVTGTATLVESATGNLTVEFSSDFAVTDGPDIQVYVSSTSNVTSSSTNIGLVKSRSGAQEYSVPFFVDFASVDYVIIHCVSFNVTFGQAAIQ